MSHCHLAVSDLLASVSALKPEEMPQVRMETDERQSAGYEVYHQKLVNVTIILHKRLCIRLSTRASSVVAGVFR